MANQSKNKLTDVATTSKWVIVLGYIFLFTGLPLQVWGDSDFIFGKKYPTSKAAIVGLVLGIIFGATLLMIGYALKSLSSKQISKAKKLLIAVIITLLVIGAYWITDFAIISIVCLVFIILAIIRYTKLAKD